jgi:serine/threonine-protein kinase RsbW
MGFSRTYAIQTNPETIRDVRTDVYYTLKQCHVAESEARALETAVGEALVNSWQHAYKMSAGPVEVHATFGDGECTIRVQDHGSQSATPPIPALPTAEAGMGLYLMAQLVDELSLQLTPQNGSRAGLLVQMRKRTSV